jgi:predicted kinase
MIERLKHLLNLDTQRFLCIGGIMASGKSTIVNEFEKVGYNVVCPDRIRVELAQKEHGKELVEGELVEYLQNYENQVWSIAKTRVIQLLKNGKSVIFDATNTTPKARKQLLTWGKQTNMPVVCVYLECPLEIALERNEQRGKTITGSDKDGNVIYDRTVPDFVIKNKIKSQILPTIQEGFTEIYIFHIGLRATNITNNHVRVLFTTMQESQDLFQCLCDMHGVHILKDLLPEFDKCWDIDQENSHHNLKLHEHMIKAAQFLQKEELSLFIATLIHDIGKFGTKQKYGKLIVDTKSFKIGDKVEIHPVPNKEGFIIAKRSDYRGEFNELMTVKHIEEDKNAHYYNHEIIGAILARRTMIELGFDEDFANRVYQYVLYHMDFPGRTMTDKQIKKLIDKVGKQMIEIMIKLKKADKDASSNNNLNEYLDNFQKINEYLKGT